MKVFSAILTAIAAACLFWILVVSIVLAPDPPEFNPVSVAPEPPSAEVIPEHVQYFRSEERAKRLGKLTKDYNALKADSDKRIAQACAAGHLDKEYCD